VSGETASGDVEAAKKFLELLKNVILNGGGEEEPTYIKVDLSKYFWNLLLM
jgi:hypothetical protein